MQLDEYFDFLGPDDIRIRGSRVGIETVLDEYLRFGRRPEEIVTSYPSLRLDEVYATILYYLRNQEAIDQYMSAWYEFGERMREEQRRNPPPGVVRLLKLLKERDASARAT